MKLSILIFAAAVLSSTVLRADDTVSNYGTGYGVGSALGIDFADASSFTAPSTGVPGFIYALESIEVVADSSFLGGNAATVSLYDSLGGLPHKAIETLDISVPQFVQGNPLSNYVIDVNSITNPTVTGGAQYWIVLGVTADFEGDVAWLPDGDGTMNPAGFDQDTGWGILGDNSYQQGAFSADFAEVPQTAPEPGTFVGLGSGLIVMAMLVQWRKQSV